MKARSCRPGSSGFRPTAGSQRHAQIHGLRFAVLEQLQPLSPRFSRTLATAAREYFEKIVAPASRHDRKYGVFRNECAVEKKPLNRFGNRPIPTHDQHALDSVAQCLAHHS